MVDFIASQCVNCGNDLTHIDAPRRGPRSKYCSKRCRERANHKYKKRDQQITFCASCGNENPPSKGGPLRVTCSDLCRSKYGKGTPRYEHACEWCKELFASHRATARFCSLSCVTSNKNAKTYADHEYAPTSKGHRARAFRYGAAYESIDRLKVFERDEWTCGICAMPVDRSLPWPDPMSASLDHIKPLARGGDHLMVNVQCSHLRCNIQKGATTYAESPYTQRAEAQAG